MSNEPRDDVSEPRGRVPIVFEALWTGVVNDWESEQRHTRFLDHVRETGGLSEAARRYGALRGDAARGPLAAKRLHAISLLATGALYATGSSQERTRPPLWLYALCVAVCLTLFACVLAAMNH